MDARFLRENFANLYRLPGRLVMLPCKAYTIFRDFLNPSFPISISCPLQNSKPLTESSVSKKSDESL